MADLLGFSRRRSAQPKARRLIDQENRHMRPGRQRAFGHNQIAGAGPVIVPPPDQPCQPVQPRQPLPGQPAQLAPDFPERGYSLAAIMMQLDSWVAGSGAG